MITAQILPYSLPNNARQIINDSFITPAAHWEVHTGQCQFTGGVYDVTDANPTLNVFCMATPTAARLIYDRFLFEVQMTIIQGDEGGLRFKDENARIYYYFGCRASDGFCALTSYDDKINNGNTPKSLLPYSSSAFHSGLNQPNKLAVRVEGNSISLYVNGQPFGHIDVQGVGAFAGGTVIGVFVREEANPTEANFNNAKVWLF